MNIINSSNYIPKVNKKKTLVYISEYYQTLNKVISESGKVFVDCPIIENVEYSRNDVYTRSRTINFDNKQYDEIYEIFNDSNQYLCELLRHVSEDGQIESIYTYANRVRRDVKQTNISSIVTKQFITETLLKNEDVNITTQHDIVQKYWKIILSINQQMKEKGHHEKCYGNEIIFTTVNELAKAYPLISIDTALEDFVQKNGPTFVSDIYKKLRDGQNLEQKIVAMDDEILTGKLYIFNDVVGKTIEVIKITFHKTTNKVGTEINAACASIYFTNLMMINLEKQHIAEVIKSGWNKEFYDFIEQNKIEVF